MLPVVGALSSGAFLRHTCIGLGHPVSEDRWRGTVDICPTGNQIPIIGICVKPQNKKYFAFPEMKTGLYPPPSRPDQRGARDRHERGTGMRWTLRLRVTTRGGCVRQRRVVLTPQAGVKLLCKSAGATVTTSPARRGDHVISRKAIAQGMSDVLRCPVCSCAHFLCTLRMRPRVQRAPGIPCAL